MTRRRHQRGQALAEFALVFPLLLLMVLILVDFGRAIYIYSALSDAAREGARYAIVHGTLATDDPPTTGPGTSDTKGCQVIYAAGATPPSAMGCPASQVQYQPPPIGLDLSQLTVGACWGFGCTVAADCTSATNTADGAIPDIPVTVRACYKYQANTAAFLRLGTIPLAAQAALTISH